MPPTLTYPGVYIEEIPSGVRTIVGVPTSITAFVGRTARGPENEATTVTSFADFERRFGGLNGDSPVSFAVRDFFLNGGSQAVIVRLFHPTLNAADFAARRTKAREAATKVANAVTGADLEKAKEAAKAEADKFTTDPEKTAAAAVLAAINASTEKEVEKVKNQALAS